MTEKASQGNQSREQGSRQSAESLFDMDQQTRALERVRMVNEMRMVNISTRGSAHAPVEFEGSLAQAIALIDLVQATTSHSKLSIILTSDTPGLLVEPTIASKISENGNYITVRGDARTDTTILEIFRHPDGRFRCRFGYSAKGTSVEQVPGSNRGIQIHINADQNSIMDESIYRLYKLTGNPSIIEYLGVRAEVNGRGDTHAISQPVDPNSYYATLGLNPYALRFLSEDTFQTMVKGIKREILRKLHPDAAQPSTTEYDYLRRMLDACSVLENKAARDEYSAWLK